jgi:hypothetical protein
MSLVRISITIPESLVRAADRRARQLDRSRSWVVVEALRRYLAGAGVQPSEPPAVREPAPPPYQAAPGDIGPYRRSQLEADLRLTPEQRVLEAERTARVSELRAPKWRGDRVLTFDTYEDYLDWERWEGRTR